jgi:hypothetical protein
MVMTTSTRLEKCNVQDGIRHYTYKGSDIVERGIDGTKLEDVKLSEQTKHATVRVSQYPHLSILLKRQNLATRLPAAMLCCLVVS